MKGTFQTVTYENRAAYEAGRSSAVFTQHNDFTAIGLEWMWNMLLGQLRSDEGDLLDHLAGARLVVGDGEAPFARTDTRLAGDQTASADLAQAPSRDGVTEDGALAVTFTGIFSEFEANFEWRERGLVTAQGVLLDRSVSDQGRKAPGTIWATAVTIELG